MDVWKKPLEIPVSALFLIGTCPVLAGCDTFCDALLLAAATVAVSALTGVILYLLRDVLTGYARFAALLVTASSLAGIALLLAEAYFPAQYSAIGGYIPLTALQCVVFDRVLSGADADALSKLARPACACVAALAVLGLLREFLSAGTLFGAQVLSSDFEALAFFGTAPGAFTALALLAMLAKGAGLCREEAPQ